MNDILDFMLNNVYCSIALGFSIPFIVFGPLLMAIYTFTTYKE